MNHQAPELASEAPWVSESVQPRHDKEDVGADAAFESRALTGQAIGILMARLDIDAEVAFSYLRRRSMHENRKLLGIAKDIIQARDIPSHWDGRVA